MIKINYKDIEKLKILYKEKIEAEIISLELKSNFTKARQDFVEKIRKDLNLSKDLEKITLKELYNKSLKENNKPFMEYAFHSFLIGSFEENKELVKNIKIVDDTDFSYLNNVFNYDDLQPIISKFFQDYIKPTTCYYCNIDFINVFQKSYESIIHFLNTAPLEELKDVNGIGEQTAMKIISERKKKEYSQDWAKHISEKGAVDGLQNFDFENVKTRNGFTLDHVIDKGKHPYLALSLFNLVPSCYTCNSKLKKSKDIGSVSPTDANFNFHEKVKFKTFINNANLQIENESDLSIFLKEMTTSDYTKYLEVFRLNDRYAFHKYRVIEMIDKRKRYPDSRIKELAELTNQSPAQVKKDLFGEYLYNDDFSKRPLSKLTHDIAEELGLI